MNHINSLKSINNWLKKQNLLATVKPLTNDASFRYYWSVNIKQNCSKKKFPKNIILMEAPSAKESVNLFVKTAEILRKNNLWKVPEIYLSDHNNGFAIIENFGSNLFSKAYVENSSSYPLIKNALKALIGLQQLPIQVELDHYSEKELVDEMILFDQWFIAKHCNYQLTLQEQKELQNIKQILCDNAQKQRQVIVHKDFHSRNLFWLDSKLYDDRVIGIIDFQDAMIGPITYDAVSLLKDCYWKLEKNDLDILLHQYWVNLHDSFTDLPNYTQWQKDFDFMGLQRHLKVLGIFCRLYYRDNKDNYLNDLPLVMEYALETCKKYKECQSLLEILTIANGKL